MADKETISIYDNQVEAYMQLCDTAAPGPELRKFLAQTPKGAHVLDFGCGPAHHAALMREHGLNVDPVDASEKMVKSANLTYNINARVATFNELEQTGVYDGVWANFSLLHVTRSDFPRHLRQIHNALKDDGIFHIAMKTGKGEERDKIGRFYTYYTESELLDLLEKAGFQYLDQLTGEDAGLSGEIAPWITVLSKKQPLTTI